MCAPLNFMWKEWEIALIHLIGHLSCTLVLLHAALFYVNNPAALLSHMAKDVAHRHRSLNAMHTAYASHSNALRMHSCGVCTVHSFFVCDTHSAACVAGVACLYNLARFTLRRQTVAAKLILLLFLIVHNDHHQPRLFMFVHHILCIHIFIDGFIGRVSECKLVLFSPMWSKFRLLPFQHRCVVGSWLLTFSSYMNA